MGCSSSLAVRSKKIKISYPCEVEGDTEVPFSERQKYFIKQSWTKLEAHKGELGVDIFVRLFEENPPLLLVFPEFRHISSLSQLKESRSLHGHTKRVMKVVENAVSGLEDGQSLREYLRELGRRHTHRHIKPTAMDFQEISDSIKRTFEAALGCQWVGEVAESWNLLLDFVIDMIVQGLQTADN